MSAERERVAGFGHLEDGLRQAGDWYRWGPYVSERQWGTVREDYSPDGRAWDYLPHDHARSRAYPYDDLIAENARRDRTKPEYELLDTGAFDENWYWIVEVHYAKADPDDILMAVQVTNAGPEADTLHVLPTAWFRNTWSWDSGAPRPALVAADDAPAGTAAVSIQHPFGTDLELIAGTGPEGSLPTALFCENETNLARLFGAAPVTGDGDPAQPPPPASRAAGRNSRWRSFDAFDIMSMPDKWEYPWFAAWDMAFHCVTMAHVDPAFAKYQLTLLCREWFQHPNGELPAYEWDFSDVNPPVQAWAAQEVFAIDGARDFDFLERVFYKLLVNFTWWVNREDAFGNDLFEGGFLGLDNIGPIDRSHLPVGGTLEQSDATGWMAFYALGMDRLISIFVPGSDGRRPCFGGVSRLQGDPAWRDNLVFSEYFHGDNAAGLGASHQTGWTGLIADVIRRRHGAVPSTGDVLADAGEGGGPPGPATP